MAKIDFLGAVSEGIEKKKKSLSVGKLILVPLCLGAGTMLLVFCGIYLGIANVAGRQTLLALDKKTLQADISIDKVNALTSEKDTVTSQLSVLDGYLLSGVAWSSKLKQLQELIPQEVWLTSLSYEARKAAEKDAPDKNRGSLLLRGNLIPSEGINFLGALSNFVNTLKESKDFYQDFDNLILAKSSSQTYKNVATMEFEILLPLKTQLRQ